jgi:hypothetical protein
VLPWWGWVLLWAVLVVGGSLWVAARARTTWRSAKALTAEVERAADLVSELEVRTSELRDLVPEHTAATQEPHRAVAQYRATRAAQAAERQARRAARRPPWARVD